MTDEEHDAWLDTCIDVISEITGIKKEHCFCETAKKNVAQR